MELERSFILLKVRNWTLMIVGVWAMTFIVHLLVGPPAEQTVGIICGALIGGTCAFKRWL